MDLDGKTAFITGASSGIGAALAIELAAAGCNVGLFARRAAELQALGERLGERALAVPGDVTLPADVQRAVAASVERFRALHILVNNAGVAVFGPLSSIPLELAEQGFRVNVFGPIIALQAALPHLISSGDGLIVNVSSGESTRASSNGPIYSATKAALNVLSASMRAEMRDRGWPVRVMTVHPGLIANEFGRHALVSDTMPAEFLQRLQRTDMGRSSEEAARHIVAAIRADHEVYRSDPSRPLVVPL